MWLFPSVASGSSLPANSRHIFSNDGLWPAKEGVVNAMRESDSIIVFISLSGFAIALFPSQGPSSLEENVLDSWRIFPRSLKMRHGGRALTQSPAWDTQSGCACDWLKMKNPAAPAVCLDAVGPQGRAWMWGERARQAHEARGTRLCGH